MFPALKPLQDNKRQFYKKIIAHPAIPLLYRNKKKIYID